MENARDAYRDRQVSVDCENPLRLLFFERWADRAALDAHFKVPQSVAFIRAVRELVSASEGPAIYAVS
jgi:quinol monooxygenase YgiN